MPINHGPVLKVYPSGNYSQWVQAQNLKTHSDTLSSEHSAQLDRAIEAHGVDAVLGLASTFQGRVLLGLVNVTKSTNNSSNRSRRGLTGIGKLGRRTVREAIYLLQQKHGTKNLGFLTETLPALPPREMKRAAKHWPKITDHFIKSIKRDLRKAGASDELAYVTEIQPKRLKAYHQVGLHLHIVFNSRGISPGWAISTERFDELWSNALSSALGYAVPTPAAGTVKPLTKSPIAELTKYMSKGAKIAREVLSMGLGDYLPPSYWGVSQSLKRSIAQQTILITAGADSIAARMASAPDWWTVWSKDIQLELNSAYTWTCATVGLFTNQAHKYIKGVAICPP